MKDYIAEVCYLNAFSNFGMSGFILFLIYLLFVPEVLIVRPAWIAQVDACPPGNQVIMGWILWFGTI